MRQKFLNVVVLAVAIFAASAVSRAAYNPTTVTANPRLLFLDSCTSSVLPSGVSVTAGSMGYSTSRRCRTIASQPLTVNFPTVTIKNTIAVVVDYYYTSSSAPTGGLSWYLLHGGTNAILCLGKINSDHTLIYIKQDGSTTIFSGGGGGNLAWVSQTNNRFMLSLNVNKIVQGNGFWHGGNSVMQLTSPNYAATAPTLAQGDSVYLQLQANDTNYTFSRIAIFDGTDLAQTGQ